MFLSLPSPPFLSLKLTTRLLFLYCLSPPSIQPPEKVTASHSSLCSLTLHIQTENMPWSFYLLNLSPTSLFLLESTIFALVQTSFLTLIVLMPPKGSPYFSHRHSNPLSKMLSDWSFQKVILSCPCLSPAQVPHRLRIKAHISWQDIEGPWSSGASPALSSATPPQASDDLTTWYCLQFSKYIFRQRTTPPGQFWDWQRESCNNKSLLQISSIYLSLLPWFSLSLLQFPHHMVGAALLERERE